jgi:hypothetical protein
MVPAGVWNGITSINKFGRNTACAGGATEEIWDGSAVYVYPATALMTHVSQTTNQAAMVGDDIEVQGLDANWEPVTQTVTLNGTDTTTAVALATPLIRAFRMRVLANTTIDSTIRLHNAAESQDYAVISVGKNQTQMAIYTVPNNQTAYITQYYATHNPRTGANATSLDIELWAQDNQNGYAPQLKHMFGLPLDGHFNHKFGPYVRLGERTDIFLTCAAVGVAASDISAGFDIILVDNDIYG